MFTHTGKKEFGRIDRVSSEVREHNELETFGGNDRNSARANKISDRPQLATVRVDQKSC